MFLSNYKIKGDDIEMKDSEYYDELKKNDNMTKKYKWKGNKWLKTLIIFWITSIIGTIFLPKDSSTGFIIFVSLIIIGYSIKSDFKREKILNKIIGVIGYYLLYSLFIALIMFILIILSSLFNVEYTRYILINGGIQAIAILTGTPILILSMKNSRSFAIIKNENEED